MALHIVIWYRVDADLMSTSLPVGDNTLAFHQANLDWTLSITKLKALQLQPLQKIGNPRYLLISYMASIPNLLQIEILVWASTLGDKTIRDLPLLIFWPEIPQKLSRTPKIASLFLVFALANKSKSSAKKKYKRT